MSMAAERVLEGLDDDQRDAATAVEGPVRIIAGAGAGKTRTVTRRIAYACASGAWDPDRVLAVTFSVKAAAELRSRLSELGVGDAVTAATFHSAALRQLRRLWPRISGSRFPSILEDQHDLVSRALTRVLGDEGPAAAALRDVQAEIGWCKTNLIDPVDYPRVCDALHRLPPADLEATRLVDVFLAYEQEKTARGRIDFDDILLLAAHVLDAFPEEAAEARRGIGWLTVDEYQDVSPLQHHLLTRWLAGNRNVCVVGDPAQTIYSFAGASGYYLLDFVREFAPLSRDVTLSRDYRSTPQVVNWANRILSSSPDRGDYIRLSSMRDDGSRVQRTVYDTDLEEAQGVARRILRMTDRGARPGDFAVLSRINGQQEVVCEALRESGLRYRVRRDGDWRRDAVDNEAAKAAMLETLGLTGDTSAVTVSTIHAAKGLEYPHVFLVGCSEGLMPFGSPEAGERLEEERRVLYVGATRACDTLHLSYARLADGMGGAVRAPSRFL
nr:ATP-dependent helicase [uncultured Bifidobacterium sp.]